MTNFSFWVPWEGRRYGSGLPDSLAIVYLLEGGGVGGRERIFTVDAQGKIFNSFLCKIKLETRTSRPHYQSHDGAHCAFAPPQSCRIMYLPLDGYCILRAPTVARGAGRTRLLDVPSYCLQRLFSMFIEGWKGHVPRAYVLSFPEDRFV